MKRHTTLAELKPPFNQRLCTLTPDNLGQKYRKHL